MGQKGGWKCEEGQQHSLTVFHPTSNNSAENNFSQLTDNRIPLCYLGLWHLFRTQTLSHPILSLSFLPPINCHGSQKSCFHNCHLFSVLPVSVLPRNERNSVQDWLFQALHTLILCLILFLFFLLFTAVNMFTICNFRFYLLCKSSCSCWLKFYLFLFSCFGEIMIRW